MTLSNYSLSKYEVTWDEYDTFLLASQRPTIKRAMKISEQYNYAERPRDPYDNNEKSLYYLKKPANDRWQDAKDYCLWLNQMTGLPFDLPTDAQFEYAARNRGQKWLYATHDGKEINWDSPYAEEIRGSTKPIGTQLPANPLGLYDMGENAWEWVNDWFSPTYYRENPDITDPQGPAEGDEKLIRSVGVGSYAFSFTRVSSSGRLEDGNLMLNGFRCAVNSNAPIVLKIPE